MKSRARPAFGIHIVNRVVRWYLTPSGLLFAAAIVLLFGWAFDIAPQVLGPLGVAALALFVPYKFSRQHGITEDLIRAQSHRTDQIASGLRRELQSHVDGPPTGRCSTPYVQESARMMDRAPHMRNSLETLIALGAEVSTVVDVGVQYGTPPLMELFPSLPHVLFEPVSDYHEEIKNRYADFEIELVGLAVSNVDGETLLKSERKTQGSQISHSYIGAEPGEDTRPMETRRLDTHFKDDDYAKPFLLKIDVEGPDVPRKILEGAQETLAMSSVVVVEMTIPRFSERHVLIEQAGFMLWDIVDMCYYDSCLWQFDAIYVPSDSGAAFSPMGRTPFDAGRWQAGFEPGMQA